MLGIYSSVGRMPFVHKTQRLIPITIELGNKALRRQRQEDQKKEVIANFVSKKVSVVKDFNTVCDLLASKFMI